MHKNNRISVIAAIMLYIGFMAVILIVKGEFSQSASESNEKAIDCEKEFNRYREEFLKKYGINLIIYDDEEIPGIHRMTFKCAELDKDLLNFIKKMEDALLMYPQQMLKKEIKYNPKTGAMKKDMDIYLVTDIFDGEERYVGFTVKTETSRDIMFLDVCDNEVSNTLAHELFHIIERKGIGELELLFNKTFSADRWEKNNPQDFSYSEMQYEDDIKHLLGKTEDIYFVSSYAKTSRSEDMAEVFGMMMSYEEDNVPDSFYSPHVINKMRFISEFLDKNYESATDEAHWNRWLNSVDK